MQHIVFVPDGVEIPAELEVEGRGIRVDGRTGSAVRLRAGWRLVPGICCGEWVLTRELEWTCPSCDQPWHQGAPGLWVAGEAPAEDDCE
ncbi:MAG TPA: hypothetical protein VFO60_01855 [Candidatus Dormibacteraeota bacterium]|nr:hypothetical protein [Candidatus Dormibacteraeota bacterium]